MEKRERKTETALVDRINSQTNLAEVKRERKGGGREKERDDL